MSWSIKESYHVPTKIDPNDILVTSIKKKIPTVEALGQLEKSLQIYNELIRQAIFAKASLEEAAAACGYDIDDFENMYEISLI